MIAARQSQKPFISTARTKGYSTSCWRLPAYKIECSKFNIKKKNEDTGTKR
jgi:hypothetical protein